MRMSHRHQHHCPYRRMGAVIGGDGQIAHASFQPTCVVERDEHGEAGHLEATATTTTTMTRDRNT